MTEMLVVDEVFRDAVLQKIPTRALQQVAVGARDGDDVAERAQSCARRAHHSGKSAAGRGGGTDLTRLVRLCLQHGSRPGCG